MKVSELPAGQRIYRVAAPHEGDKLYLRGQNRVADPAAVAQLVALGVLVDITDGLLATPDYEAVP